MLGDFIVIMGSLGAIVLAALYAAEKLFLKILGEPDET